jgi:uncharacterized membrane protein
LDKGRIEAFSDGVIAIIITIMVLELKVPHGEGPDSMLRTAVGNDWKGKLSPVIYLTAIPTAFAAPWLAQSLYVLVALIWLVPDRRIERAIVRAER